MQTIPPRSGKQSELEAQPVTAHPQAAQPAQPAQSAQVAVVPARTLIGAYLRAARLDAALALSLPAACSAVAVWWQTGTLRPGVLIFTLVSVLFVALGAHLLSAFYDGEAAATAAAAEKRAAYGVGSAHGPTIAAGNPSQEHASPDLVHSLAYLLLSLAGVCALWAGLLAGWPIVLFQAAAITLVVGYAVPPVRYGARGWGLGEAGLFLALGVLPALASFYGQAGTLDTLVTWSALPFALLGAAIVLNHSLLHYRRDWLIRKRTLAVSLGPARAIDLGALLVIGAFVAILLGASIAELPLRAIIALAALPIAAGPYSRLDRDELTLPQGMALYSATINATLATALLFCLALITQRIW
jgi:1,4-dihydroxy-2-naphthoate octaprenyltransferase